MNEKTFRKTALAAATFLALSTFAFAQTSGTSPSGQAGTTGGGQVGTTTGAAGATAPAREGAAVPQPGSPTTQSGAAPTAAQGQPAGTARMPTKSDNAQSAFKMLDSANRGYVTREEMDRMSGFSGFDAADMNRDGRLSQEEFAKAWGTYGTAK